MNKKKAKVTFGLQGPFSSIKKFLGFNYLPPTALNAQKEKGQDSGI